MAAIIMLKHKETGIVKKGFYGFSWTTLFFGGIPALFRQDFLTFFGLFAISILIGFWSYGIGSLVVGLVWAFMYNKYYTRRLIEKGHVFNDTPQRIEAACAALNITAPNVQSEISAA